MSVVQIAGAVFSHAPDDMLARLDDLGGCVVGAARLSYADEATLKAPDTSAVEDIDVHDPRLARMEAAADHDEWWEAVCLPKDDIVQAAVDADGELEAIGMIEDWSGITGHIGVITRADCRGQGLAGVVAGAAAQRALEQGMLPQWRARVGNDASQRACERLGFVTLGVQIFVRFPALPT
jgi:RimJ/RimL family protein N-acetyltransferase